MTTDAGLLGAPLKASPPLWLNTLDDMRKHASLAASTEAVVPYSIENSQLQSPSLITDAPLKLWLKRLDSETLEVLYNKCVAVCAYLMWGEHDIPRRHQGRETYSPNGEDSV